MSGHHDHHHDHDHSELSETQLRVRALETVLTEKGYVDPAALDLLIETYEKKVGPRNGARVVAKAWADPAYRARLFKDATPAIAELGFAGRQGEHIVALENTPKLHNMVVCTLCSCYPWPVLGLPPVWYKSAPYRSRAVADPRGVLADFGVTLAEGHRNPRVGFHRRDSLSGGADAARRHRRLERRQARGPGHARFHDRHRPAEAAEGREMNGAQDLGGTHGHGPVEPELSEPVFHAEWERRAFALTLAMGMPGGWNIDMSRFARENRPPAEYLSMSYYQIWFAALETMLAERGSGCHRRGRCRPFVASAEAGQAHAVARRRRASALSRRADRTRDQHRGEIQGRRQRAREEHQSPHPYAAAALCARPCRHDRARHRLPRFPDSNATGAGENPQWLYTVRFDGRELWGADADPTVKVSVDAWEPYLEPA